MSWAEEPRGDWWLEAVPMGELAHAIPRVVKREAAELLTLPSDEGRAGVAAERAQPCPSGRERRDRVALVRRVTHKVAAAVPCDVGEDGRVL